MHIQRRSTSREGPLSVAASRIAWAIGAEISGPQTPTWATEGTRSSFVSIIILTRNKLELTSACIDSVLKRTHAPFELIIVDSGSSDGTQEYVQNLRTRCEEPVRFVRGPDPFIFGRNCNIGAELAAASHLLFLNNDTVVATDNWTGRMLAALNSSPRVGSVGPMTRRNRNPLQVTSAPDVGEAPRCTSTVFPLTGFCLLMRKDVFNEIGGFDIRYDGYGCDEIDLGCQLLRRRYLQLVARNVLVLHHHRGTFRDCRQFPQLFQRNLRLFREKWGFDLNGGTFWHRYRYPRVSVCVVVRDAGPCLAGFLRATLAALDSRATAWEITVADVGSMDESAAILRLFSNTYPSRLSAMRLARYTDPNAAMRACVDRAHGERKWVVQAYGPELARWQLEAWEDPSNHGRA